MGDIDTDIIKLQKRVAELETYLPMLKEANANFERVENSGEPRLDGQAEGPAPTEVQIGTDGNARVLDQHGAEMRDYRGPAERTFARLRADNHRGFSVTRPTPPNSQPAPGQKAI